MTRTAIALALALAGTLAAPVRADDYLQAEPKTFDPGGAKRLHLEFPVGKLTLEGDDGSTIRIQVRVDCKGMGYDDCKDEARRLRIDHTSSDGTRRPGRRGRTFVCPGGPP